MIQLAAFKAEYGKLYPEAVRSLAEEEEKPLTFDEFPQTMRCYIWTTNTIESLFSNVCPAPSKSVSIRLLKNSMQPRWSITHDYIG